MIQIGINTAARHARLAREVNDERARRIAVGSFVTVPGVGSIPTRDQSALTNLGMAAQGMVASGDLTTRTKFRDITNVIHILSPEQMVALWRGTLAATQEVHEASWRLKDVVEIPDDFASDARWPRRDR